MLFMRSRRPGDSDNAEDQQRQQHQPSDSHEDIGDCTQYTSLCGHRAQRLLIRGGTRISHPHGSEQARDPESEQDDWEVEVS
ncbi:hypothetical protein ACUXIL_005178 [Ralstonia pickettii]|jgi:hypothetical protein|uniref:Uncharacterized protein n=2 Tax=Ralstonia TaxID=48736 RepID=A0ABC8Q4J3_9RALS|nr:hypothetical protein DL763_009615 [Monosporascus cannonballus]RYP59162.1 hypothetical protein DL771_010988 [Monosporascus sp. 5C6A]CAJ0728660.1 hypothetical protein R38712_03780 [Ralstonia pickettii]CAJ0773872.1 hypothetical protein LMG18096_00063 [Ralstonia sp. LMG 32967]